MAEPEVRVWDPAVRILHWTLVASVAIAAATAEAHGRILAQVHEWAGYVALAVVALRILWGIAGSRAVRFAAFVRSPDAVIAYAKSLVAGRERRYLGHNPLGGWMIVALLAMVAFAAGSGALYVTDRFWGLKWMEEMHEFLAHVLYALVALHVAGALFTGWRHGENLVRAMFTGRKRAPGADDVA